MSESAANATVTQLVATESTDSNGHVSSYYVISTIFGPALVFTTNVVSSLEASLATYYSYGCLSASAASPGKVLVLAEYGAQMYLNGGVLNPTSACS
jgi:hypothetical protein